MLTYDFLCPQGMGTKGVASRRPCPAWSASSLWRTPLASVLVVLLSGLLAVRTVAANQAPDRAVEAIVVHYADSAKPITVSAQLRYKATSKLAFKMGGLVEQVLVERGDRVEQGQTLARLDSEEVAAQLAEANTRFANAERHHQRTRKLYEQQVVALQRFQDAQAELEVARSKLRIARFNLKHAEIKAPEAGTILQRAVEPSEFVVPNQTAFVISDESRGWVMHTALSDRNVVQVAPGDSATIHFDLHPLKVFQGQVSTIAFAAQPQTGLFETEIALHAPDRPLREGFIGRIEITPHRTLQVAKMPTTVLVSASGLAGSVFVVQNGRALLRKVTIAYIEGGEVAIVGDVHEGEQVITTGAELLKPNDRVLVKRLRGAQVPRLPDQQEARR